MLALLALCYASYMLAFTSTDEVSVVVGELLVFYLSLHCTGTVYAVFPSMLVSS